MASALSEGELEIDVAATLNIELKKNMAPVIDRILIQIFWYY